MDFKLISGQDLEQLSRDTGYTTSDFDYRSGDLRFTEPGVESVAQAIRLELLTLRGSNIFDINAGTDKSIFLGRKGIADTAVIAELRRVVSRHLDNVTTFDVIPNSVNRTFSLKFSGTINGQAVENVTIDNL